MNSRVAQAIGTAFRQSGEPWFPELAERLTQDFWLRQAKGDVRLSDYGTHRWLTKDTVAERWKMAEVTLSPGQTCRVEVLPPASQSRYEDLGLVFPSPTVVARATSVIDAAVSFIALAPTLHKTIAAYLFSLHILEAPRGNVDVSHSDPDVPFSIFASVPPHEKNGRVRLAESIIHESMHLQLTMIEGVVPLVACEAHRGFSPWQRSPRPLSGVLHGLYVFAVIDAFYRIVRDSPSLSTAERQFVDKRRRELAEEVRHVDDPTAGRGLTLEGKTLFRRLLEQFGSCASRPPEIVVSHGAKH